MNFYKTYPIDKEAVSTAVKKVETGILTGNRLLEEEGYDELKSLKKQVCIAKIVIGWKAGCWVNSEYQSDRASLDIWLRNTPGYIEDETGYKYTVDEFWDKIESHNTDHFNNFDYKTYTNQLGHSPIYRDFYDETGLRWIYSNK